MRSIRQRLSLYEQASVASMRPAFTVRRGFPHTVLPTRLVPLALSFRSLLIVNSIKQHSNRSRSPLHAWLPGRISPACSSSSQSPHRTIAPCLPPLGILCWLLAWAEDRAPWRHDPSADPGAKTEGGRHDAALFSPSGLARKRQIDFFGPTVTKLLFTLSGQIPG
jgi:hypothetical protein